MPLDLSAWELSRMLIALLVGIALVAIPAAVLLIRARRRESRLRRQIARLTTSQALLGGPNRSGSARRDETDEPGPVVPAQAGPERGGSQVPDSGAAPSAPEPEPVIGPVVDVPVAQLPGDGAAPANGRVATASAEAPAPAAVDPDPPTQPDRGDHVPRQSPRAAESDIQQQEPQTASTFGSEESAERFRRDYTDPMEEHRRRLAQLRSQLGDAPIDQGTTPVHNG